MNLHIHSRYSDGRMDANSILQRANEMKMDVIGITDHFATNKLQKEYKVNNLTDYILDLREIQQLENDISLDSYNTNGNGTKLLLGLEIDCGMMGIKISESDIGLINNLDFCLLEYIQDKYWKGKNIEDVNEELIKKLKIPVGLAHNNLMKNFNLHSREKCRDLCKFLSENKIFVELNEGESYCNSDEGKYYFELFSEDLIIAFKDYNIKFSIGTDSHSDYLLNNTQKSEKFVVNNNLDIVKFI